MKYFKLLALNLMVAAVMAIALTGNSQADGVDDPKFYNTPSENAPKNVRSYGQIFEKCMSSRFNNMASICRQYDDMGTFNWPNDIIDIPSTIVVNPGEQKADVPEPPALLMLGWAFVLIFGYRAVLKNTAIWNDKK